MGKEAYILTGPPTSGKSSQASLLAQRLGFPVIRGRDIVPELSDQCGSFRNLIPDHLFIPNLKRLLDELNSPLIILDNVPRTSEQAIFLYEWLKDRKTNLSVVKLVLSEEEVVERTKKRLACPVCGETYHLDLKPPKIDGFCDIDSNLLAKRAGDTDEKTVVKGFRDYQRLVIGWMKVIENHIVVYEIDAKGTVKETFQRVEEALDI